MYTYMYILYPDSVPITLYPHNCTVSMLQLCYTRGPLEGT